MKQFEETIKTYLQSRKDLEEKLRNPRKSIKECCSYIISQAKKEAKGESACCLEDRVVYGWAVHYYDEEEVGAVETVQAKVLTAEKKSVKKAPAVHEQLTLFDL